jgi:hypothetical protein
VNLPFSKQFGDMYLHWNGGFTHLPAAAGETREHNLFSPHAAVSAIWRARPMLNLMLESAVGWEELVAGPAERRDTALTIAPGLRTGWNAGEAQTIFGFAIPVAFSDDRTDVSVFGYFSYELPFIRP